MKVTIRGIDPELTIANMSFGTDGYCPFKNIIVTKKNFFICLDTQVYKTPQEIFQFYRSDCDYFHVERGKDGKYFFNFGDIFSRIAVIFHPTEYDEWLAESDNFIALSPSIIEILDLKSEIAYFSQEELEGSLKEIDSVINLSSLTRQQLEEERIKAVDEQDFERAARLRDELDKRN